LNTLEEYLKEPIDNIYNEKLKSYFNEFIENRENFDYICKNTLVTPLNEISYISRYSKEYKEFKKTIKIDQYVSHENLLKFISNIKEYNEDVVFKLSQFLYYELYYYNSFCNNGRFIVEGGYPSRKISEEDINKILLLDKSLIDGFKLKEEDKICIHPLLGAAFTLGEWGKLKASELMFDLIIKSLNIIGELINKEPEDDIYIPIRTTHSPGPFYDKNNRNSEFNNK